MSVWTDISEKVGEGSKIVAEKARELSQVASLRAQIVACNNVMNKNFKELGKAYYEEHKGEATEYDDIMQLIADSEAKKAELRAQLDEIRNASADNSEDSIDDVDDIIDEALDEADEITEDEAISSDEVFEDEGGLY